MTTPTHALTTILVYDDIAAAHDFLVKTFGLAPGQIVRNAEGEVMHGEVSIGTETVWLHRVSPEHGLGSVAKLGAATGMLNVFVDDVDAHFTQVQAAGARIDFPPTDMPYGQREYAAFDCEGRIWSFATRT